MRLTDLPMLRAQFNPIPVVVKLFSSQPVSLRSQRALDTCAVISGFLCRIDGFGIHLVGGFRPAIQDF
jgi:hypothetical protein